MTKKTGDTPSVAAAVQATQEIVGSIVADGKVTADVQAAQAAVTPSQAPADVEAADVAAAAAALADALQSGNAGDIKDAVSDLFEEVEDLEDLADARILSLADTYDWHDIQRRLKNLSFYRHKIDGIRDPKTDAAIVKFKQSIGYKARPYYGPLTHKALMGARVDPPRVRETPGTTAEDLPWMVELEERMGWHERTDNAELKEWLKEGTVGVDPAKIPWCGDLVETAIYSTLPDEPRFKNPLLARNWKNFGRDCKPQYGCVAHFWRGSRNGIYGHVAFLIGYDAARKRYRMRGGNQSNMIRDDWIDEDRLLGCQWPITYPETDIPLPRMNSKGQRLSENEA
jgi:uncharacterized protein (TIGR02594 family)